MDGHKRAWITFLSCPILAVNKMKLKQDKMTLTLDTLHFRLFQLGRTDNINPVSSSSIAWVHAMEDPTLPHDSKVTALRTAVSQLSKVRIQTTAGFGCDRHMLGLQMAAREMGVDVPRVFKDKVTVVINKPRMYRMFLEDIHFLQTNPWKVPAT